MNITQPIVYTSYSDTAYSCKLAADGTWICGVVMDPITQFIVAFLISIGIVATVYALSIILTDYQGYR